MKRWARVGIVAILFVLLGIAASVCLLAASVDGSLFSCPAILDVLTVIPLLGIIFFSILAHYRFSR